VTQKPKTCWWWIKCTRCPHMAAVASAPFIIRWGPDGVRRPGERNVPCRHSERRLCRSVASP
jgi:hypothetical protein